MYFSSSRFFCQRRFFPVFTPQWDFLSRTKNRRATVLLLLLHRENKGIEFGQLAFTIEFFPIGLMFLLRSSQGSLKRGTFWRFSMLSWPPFQGGKKSKSSAEEVLSIFNLNSPLQKSIVLQSCERKNRALLALDYQPIVLARHPGKILIGSILFSVPWCFDKTSPGSMERRAPS